MELRTLTIKELKEAYKRDLREAFPVNELRPLRTLCKLCERGEYEPLAAFIGGKAVGYAFLWKDADGFLLFDYLAVSVAERNHGLGTQILQGVLRRYEDAPAVFGEVEAPTGRDEKKDRIILRRLGFYERNGIVPQGYDCKLFGVHYHVVGRTAPGVDRAELIRHHAAFYRRQLSAWRYKRFVQIPF